LKEEAVKYLKMSRSCIILGLGLSGLLLATACRKSQITKDFSFNQTAVNTRINKTFWLDQNCGFFCGGEKSQGGYVYKTFDGGASWTEVHRGPNSIYDLLFVNDSLGYACGENIEILKSTDAGQSWQSIVKQNNSDKHYYGTLRGIVGNDKLLLFVGGANFNIGIVNRLANGELLDGFVGFSNELRCGFGFASDNYLVCGYGTGFKTEDKGFNFKATSVSGDFFTASCMLKDGSAFACSYNGAVYKITAAGHTIEKVFDYNRGGKKRINFNGIYFVDENKGWVVGNNGALFHCQDGKNFTQIKSPTSNNFLSVTADKNNQIIISDDKGKIFRLPY
jgi:photosystem II stability/assembly factor-like uncharacterized protein